MAPRNGFRAIRSAPAKWRLLTALTCVALSFSCGDKGPTGPTITPKPLALSCPTDVTSQAAAGQTSAVVDYAAPVVTGGIVPIETSCAPQSGTSFPVGTTPVQCRASDAASAATCTFSVIVEPAPPPPRLSTTTFLAFGDSLTEGKVSLAFAPWMLVESDSAYTLKLQAMLQERYWDQTIVVINEGLGGERARDGVSRLDRTIDQNRPGALLLMDGANDLAGAGHAGISQAADALDTMIAHARARGVDPFLATLPPQIPDRQRSAGAPYVVPFNDRIRALAAARSVHLVDVYAAFNGDLSLVGSDGLHLNDGGYHVVARAFYAEIVAALEVRTTSAPR